MKHLKLSKGLSYMGHGVTVTRQEPDVFVEDADTAAALIATGYFTEAGNEPVTPPQAAPTGTIEAIDTMGVTKLRPTPRSMASTRTGPPRLCRGHPGRHQGGPGGKGGGG